MDRIETSSLIHQPVERVFQFALDPQKLILWQPDILESVLLPADPESSFIPFRIKTQGWAGFNIEVIIEPTVVTPDKEYVFRTTEIHGWITSLSQWIFEKVPGGTRVSVQHDVELHGGLQLLRFAFIKAARKKHADDLTRLKELLETT